ncbi:hypothetical protein U9M48_028988 [Paspalum notatum var. saurae]|uniref:Uncharacterized protein n=1 Tax=Paspalum notatum var. saurae TaxID=547442 RepID=A0AAQ3TYF3_PASNO
MSRSTGSNSPAAAILIWRGKDSRTSAQGSSASTGHPYLLWSSFPSALLVAREQQRPQAADQGRARLREGSQPQEQQPTARNRERIAAAYSSTEMASERTRAAALMGLGRSTGWRAAAGAMAERRARRTSTEGDR